MTVGSGSFTYEIAEGWGEQPSEWRWGWNVGMACDSNDRVFVYGRSEKPLNVYSREGKLLETWGEDILPENTAHGLFIDQDDNVFCTAFSAHAIYKFNAKGEHVMTMGTPGTEGQEDGIPFRQPTDLVVAPSGDIYVSGGYGNARVHRYSSTGTLLHSWGEWGTGPGQFELSHCVRIDRHQRVWVCDRANDRIQIFDLDGNYLSEWNGLAEPNTIFFDPNEEVVYVAELQHQLSIYTMDQQLITQWGGRKPSDGPNGFLGGVHGIWMDSHGDLYTGEVLIDEKSRMHKYIRKQ
ncbi:MAG: hypothetical protein HOH43_21715 [Candidatus Latescibacteria bacterium]|jgi:sugar lactone lactonase YvrE|nr:hypothetical protein [Candidatus Latescibacterota bacterium]